MKTPSKKVVLAFTQQLAALLKAGLTLADALCILQQKNSYLTSIIIDIKKVIASGETFYTALSKHPTTFDYLFRQLVHVGEMTGKLDVLLDKIAGHLDNSLTFKKKITGILFYPLFIIIMISLITTGLFLFVVPKFTELLSAFNATLPFYTRCIIGIGHFISYTIGYTLCFLPLTILAMRHLRKKSIAYTQWQDNIILQIPIIGSLLHKVYLTRVLYTLSVCYTSGLTIPESITHASNVCNHCSFQSTLKILYQRVLTGEAMHIALQKNKLFPAHITQMIGVGEQAGTLTDMLTILYTHLEKEIDTTLKKLSQLIEPILMLLIGTIVGSVMIALYLPMINMGNALQGIA